MLPFIFVALAFAFGALYLNTVFTDCLTKATIISRFDAAYTSVSNLATFTYDSEVFPTRPAKCIAVFQIASGILLLICAFPLFVSRIADFGTSIRKIIFHGRKIFFPDCDNATITIGDGSLEWRKGDKSVTVVYKDNKLEITKDAVPSAISEILVIESDGTCHWK